MNKKWAALILIVMSSLSKSESFRENFSEGLAPERWRISTWTAPNGSITHLASFSKEHVEIIDGVLRLKLTQSLNENGSVVSVGAEIMTLQSFSYGTYTYTMKASSDASLPSVNGKAWSGSITGSAVYAEKSVTEIDIEVEGLEKRQNLTTTSTWVNEITPETKKIPPSMDQGRPPHEGFHDYKIVWVPGMISFYRDGTLIATHQGIVPTQPAPFLFNHWGTNDPKWGGLATPGVDRYMYIKEFIYTPL